MGQDGEGAPGPPGGRRPRAFSLRSRRALQPGAAGDPQPRGGLPVRSGPTRSRRLAGACAAAGRRECLTRSLLPALPSGERAGVVLHALYSPHRPGESGGTLAPGPAASAGGQLGACRPLQRVGRAPGPRSWPCPPPGSGRRKVLGGLHRGLAAPSGVRGGREVGAGLSAWSLGRLTAVSVALAGRGAPGFPPCRSPSSVRRWARSQVASAWPAAGAPAWLLCQAPRVASRSSCASAANSPGKNASGSHLSVPAAASLWFEMVSAFSSVSF